MISFLCNYSIILPNQDPHKHFHYSVLSNALFVLWHSYCNFLGTSLFWLWEVWNSNLSVQMFYWVQNWIWYAILINTQGMQWSFEQSVWNNLSMSRIVPSMSQRINETTKRSKYCNSSHMMRMLLTQNYVIILYITISGKYTCASNHISNDIFLQS